MNNTMEAPFIGPPEPTDSGNEINSLFSQAINAMKEGASIAGILRVGGAGLMVFSLSLFLMDGMDATSDLQRYFLLLAQTVLLTTAGFAVGMLLKEPRGARVFFSLALVSIPANFAVLGAMIYSIVPLDDLLRQYPSYATWKSASISDLLIASAAGLAVLLPMSVFCFAVLARNSKWWLSGAYLLSSASLLIPVRDTFSITIISSICAVGVLLLISNRKKLGNRLATSEEKFAKTLLLIPAALVLARSAMLYDIDFHFALSIVIALYYLMRRIVIARSGSTALTVTIQILTSICALVLACMIASLLESYVPAFALFLVVNVIWLALNVEIRRFIDSPKVYSFIHGMWAMLFVVGIGIDVVFIGTVTGYSIDTTISVVIVVASIVLRQKSGVVLGLLALAALLSANGLQLISIVVNAGWMGMAAAGATTIVAGSLLERFWPVIKLRLVTRFGRFSKDSTDYEDIDSSEELDAEPVRIAA